jgi:hypothetical protein
VDVAIKVDLLGIPVIRDADTLLYRVLAADCRTRLSQQRRSPDDISARASGMTLA